MSKLADRRGFRLNTQAVYSWVSRACAARLYDWAVSPCSTDQPSTNKTIMSYLHIEQDLASPSPAFRPFARPRRLFDALAAKIQAAEKVQTFIEEHIEELKTTQPEGGPPAQSLSNRKRRPKVEKDKAELMENQIESFKKLPCELKKPASAEGEKQEGLKEEHHVIAIRALNYAEG